MVAGGEEEGEKKPPVPGQTTKNKYPAVGEAAGTGNNPKSKSPTPLRNLMTALPPIIRRYKEPLGGTSRPGSFTMAAVTVIPLNPFSPFFLIPQRP
jgi:hypothetical protein